MSRVMGIDVGAQRVGIALSDPLRLIAQPHATIPRRGGREIHDILAIVRKQGVEEVVVGLPLQLDGDAGDAAREAERFAKSLERIAKRERIALRTVLWDERFSTDAAERVVRDRALHGAERSAALDRVAASLILDAYLQSLAQPDRETS